MGDHDGSQFDRLPAGGAAGTVTDRPTRAGVLNFFEQRFAIPPETFDGHTFWEKGRGNVWAFAGTLESPLAVEALGIHVLRTDQRHWKPTTDGVQRFGGPAARNVLDLSAERAATFWRGDTQAVDASAGPGYVIVRRQMAAGWEPLGVGLLLDGELRSQVPKGRRRDLSSR